MAPPGPQSLDESSLTTGRGKGAGPGGAPTSARTRSEPRTNRAAERISPCCEPAPPPFEQLLKSRLQSVSSFVSWASTSEFAADKFESQRDGFGGSKPSKLPDSAPTALLFPSSKPSSRADAIVLDKWVSEALAGFANKEDSKHFTEPGEEGKSDLSGAVEELVPVLSIAFHETVRQVTHHCFERGIVLEKIWRTYVELFSRALTETRAALKRHKESTAQIEARLADTRQELANLQEKHPNQIAKLTRTLGGKFQQRQEELEEQLKYRQRENVAMQQHHKEQKASVRSWFPNFDQYQDSPHRLELARIKPCVPAAMTPEAGVAADFHRILSALPEQAQRRIGLLVASPLGLRHGVHDHITVEALEERKLHNDHRIKDLQERLVELKASKDVEPPDPPAEEDPGAKKVKFEERKATSSPSGFEAEA